MPDTDPTAILTPPFATKIAVLVRDDLQPWQELNVTAFLAAGIAAAHPELVGLPYADADGGTYLPLLGMPVLVFQASGELLATALGRARTRGQRVALYTHDMFSTGHDAANRAAVASVAQGDLDLVGLALHGPKSRVDKIVKGAALHP